MTVYINREEEQKIKKKQRTGAGYERNREWTMYDGEKTRKRER